MSRRASLPGADELFRATGPISAPSAVSRESARPVETAEAAASDQVQSPEATTGDAARHPVARRRSKPADRRPTGRERHDEKITVYCSPDELMDLERARLTLRGDFGVAVDRGRIVREAIALALEDLESRGADSALVRRLSGR